MQVRPHSACVYRRLGVGKSLVAGRGYAQRSSSVCRPPSLPGLDLIPTRYSGRGARALRAGVAGQRSHGWRSAGSFERRFGGPQRVFGDRARAAPAHAGRRRSPSKPALQYKSSRAAHLVPNRIGRRPELSVKSVVVPHPDAGTVLVGLSVAGNEGVLIPPEELKLRVCPIEVFEA